MKVTLRQRKKGNTISLYLDYYEKGKREYEYLGLYLVPKLRADFMDYFEALCEKKLASLGNYGN